MQSGGIPLSREKHFKAQKEKQTCVGGLTYGKSKTMIFEADHQKVEVLRGGATVKKYLGPFLERHA